MDVHMKSNNRLQFGTNEATVHNPGDDELKFLSPEEQEIIHFFEQTIDSLEQSLEEDELKPPHVKSFNDQVEIDCASKCGPHRQTNPKEQDIIDLVQTNLTSPDFQSLVPPPESHVHVKLCSDPVDPLSLTEYNPTLPESHPVYHPPGSIPTPALIAQKIAENQTSGSTVLSASSLLRRRSSEFDKSTKQGLPTSTSTGRYPGNINVILGSREQQIPSLANINIEERRAQMLANLSGTAHPLLQENHQQDQTARNIPTRSVSFRDPTPEKSRMEALSKLGLSRTRASSGDLPLPSTLLVPPVQGGASTTNVEKTDSIEPLSHKEMSIASNVVPITTVQEQSTPPSRQRQEHSSPAAVSTKLKLPETSPRAPLLSYSKPDAPPPDAHQTLESRYSPTQTYSQKDYFPPPPPPVESSAEFNSYGGKSIVVNSSPSFRSDLPPSPVNPELRSLSPGLATPGEFNSYGGKSKVMTPIPAPVSRDLPDILSSHIDKSQSLHSAPENASIESNSYGGKSRIINPAGSADHPSEGFSRTLKPPAPTPAPRPPRHSYHGLTVPQKPPQRALSPEHKRKTGSLFRPQGITVQFSGKGASEESRKEALRKLGLLKD